MDSSFTSPPPILAVTAVLKPPRTRQPTSLGDVAAFRLRAQVALRLNDFPQGSATVVRALPEAAHASSAELGADLDATLHVLASRQ